jgi:hypothetical protein
MHVTIEFGPAFGQTRHVTRDQVTSLLLDLGLIKLVPEEKPAAPTPSFPEWSIVSTAPNGSPAIRHCIGKSTRLYSGAPRPDAFKAMVWSGDAGKQVPTGPDIPQGIFEQYKKAYASTDARQARE